MRDTDPTYAEPDTPTILDDNPTYDEPDTFTITGDEAAYDEPDTVDLVGRVVRHAYVDAMTNEPAEELGVVVAVEDGQAEVAKLPEVVTVPVDALEVVS